MKIKKKFIQLTKQTYPHGTESMLENSLPIGYKKDTYGNYYIIIGENPTTMFTCHLDTYSKKKEYVKHVFKGNFIMTDGTTILGADDKAGMVVVLYMIEKKVPGIYYFFIGEESGCIGSKEVAESIESRYYVFSELKNVNKVVSFDRKGTSSIITEQLYTECCSNEFATELANRLNSVGNGLQMAPDKNGVCTDSAQFMGIISECTNISVGYYDEHRISERQDIDFLYKICQAVVEVNWETLPVSRIPESSWLTGSSCRSYGLEDWDCPWDNSLDYNNKSSTVTKKRFEEDFCREYYTFVLDPKDNVRKLAYISKMWVNHEAYLIETALKKQGINVKNIVWDGTSCWVAEHGYTVMDYYGSRRDILVYLDTPEVPIHHLLFEEEVGSYERKRGKLKDSIKTFA